MQRIVNYMFITSKTNFISTAFFLNIKARCSEQSNNFQFSITCEMNKDCKILVACHVTGGTTSGAESHHIETPCTYENQVKSSVQTRPHTLVLWWWLINPWVLEAITPSLWHGKKDKLAVQRRWTYIIVKLNTLRPVVY